MAENNGYSRLSASMDTVFNTQLTESWDAKPEASQGRLYILKNCMYFKEQLIPLKSKNTIRENLRNTEKYKRHNGAAGDKSEKKEEGKKSKAPHNLLSKT